MARGLEFQIQEVEGMYYKYSENKGTDQLRGHRAADLRLCFSPKQKHVFFMKHKVIDVLINGEALAASTGTSLVLMVSKINHKKSFSVFIHSKMLEKNK